MGFLGGAETMRNPFSYGSAGNDPGQGSTTNLSLKGIIWDPDNPLAVINEQTVGIGDNFGDFKIKQIRQESVVLGKDNSELELKLSQ